MLLLIYVMVEGVLILEQFVVLDHAVREGARYASIGHATADIQACTKSRAGSLLSSNGTVNVTYSPTIPATGTPSTSTSVQVSLSGYTYNIISSFSSLNYSLPSGLISPQTTMRLETATPAATSTAGACVG